MPTNIFVLVLDGKFTSFYSNDLQLSFDDIAKYGGVYGEKNAPLSNLQVCWFPLRAIPSALPLIIDHTFTVDIPYSGLFSRRLYLANSLFNSCSRKVISRMEILNRASSTLIIFHDFNFRGLAVLSRNSQNINASKITRYTVLCNRHWYSSR